MADQTGPSAPAPPPKSAVKRRRTTNPPPAEEPKDESTISDINMEGDSDDSDFDDLFPSLPAQILIQPKAPNKPVFTYEERPALGNAILTDRNVYARRIELDEFDGFIICLYNYIEKLLCHGYSDSPSMLTLDEFRIAMRFFQQMRLFIVAKNWKAGGTVPGTVNQEKGLLLPKCFAKILNDLGLCSMNRNTVFFVPFPAKEKQTDNINEKFNKIRNKYVDFITELNAQKALPLDNIAGSETGTYFWLLDLASTDNLSNAPLRLASSMKVLSYFGDLSPAEPRMATIACRRNASNDFYKAWTLTEDPDTTTKTTLLHLCETQRYVRVVEDRAEYISAKI